jgi:hypothetical protein
VCGGEDPDELNGFVVMYSIPFGSPVIAVTEDGTRCLGLKGVGV